MRGSSSVVAALAAGIARTDSAFFTGAPVPAGVQGSQVLYVMGSAVASQVVYLPAGTYTVSFKAVQRQNLANQQQVIQLKVGSIVVATFKPTGSAFQDFAASFTLGADGIYTLSFAGATTGTDSAFIDAVSIAPSGARASYAAYYYDAAGRLVQAVDVGTNGGRGFDRPASAPARSDVVLVDGYAYDDAGRLAQFTDPRGVHTRYSYDALGRVVQAVANANALPAAVGAPTASANYTTRYAYNGLDRVVSVTAVMPNAADNQVTTYNYGVSASPTGGKVASNALLASEVQPDGATKAYEYNALGQVIKATDPNSTVHAYAYDALGRLRSDAVTEFGAGVDQAVKRLETAYDSAGRAYLFTSYDAASGGAVVNQVKRTFNGYGQVGTEYQSHSGPVVDATTLKVVYAYSTPNSAAGVNHSRLESVKYPASGASASRTVGYVYDQVANGGLDAAVGRVTKIVDVTSSGPVDVESYKYLGLGTVVERRQHGDGVKLSYVRQIPDAAAGSDAGDMYSGLDRFGRVVDQNWVRTDGPSAGTSTVRLQYGYDRAGNATHRRDMVNAALSELYQYDQLDRLVSMKRGVLSAANDAIASPTFQQSWTLDAQGNQASATTNSVTVSKTFNKANEVATVDESSAAAPTYDVAGNTTAKDGRSYVYDAWNRLKRVASGSTTLASYAYDALRRRVVETSAGVTSDVYFDRAAPIEERVGSFAYQHVIGATGDVVLRDVYENIAGAPRSDWRYFAQQDVNGDVVALANPAGTVVERYAYAPYGAVSLLDAAGAPKSSSGIFWRQLFQGGRHDAATGLYVFGFRDYDPSAGTWMQRDPIGLGGGDTNIYRFVGNNPTNFADPSGLAEWYNDDWTDWVNPFAYMASYGGSQGERIGSGYGEFSNLNPARDMAMDQLARDRAHTEYNADPLNVDLMGRLRSIDSSRTRSDLSSAGKIADGAAAGAELATDVATIATGGMAAAGRFGRPRPGGMELCPPSIRGGAPESSIWTHIPTSGRKFNQINRRGWTRPDIHHTVNNPFTTRRATNKSNGNPATAYFNQDGSHVIRDDITGDLIQLSDRNNPQSWIPDPVIIDPYIPPKPTKR
jgi:RHS repeat-associated protein